MNRLEEIKRDDADTSKYVNHEQLDWLIKVAETTTNLYKIIDSSSPDILYSKEFDELEKILEGLS